MSAQSSVVEAPPITFAVPPTPVLPTGESTFQLEDKYVQAAKALARAVEGETKAWERLAYLCDRFGVRLSGSPGLEAAGDWALEQMRSDGLSSVRREPVMVPRWVRGEESAVMVAPVERKLWMLGLGGTVGTGGKPLRGKVLVARSIDDLEKLGEAARGRIVLIDEPMPEYDHDAHSSGYGSAVQKRLHGAARAAKLGAKALMIRSVTAFSMRTPHTGVVLYDEGVPKIPAIALSTEDASMLSRWVARGEDVEVELKLAAKTLPDAPSGNIVGEIKGRERPEEIVLIGCHLDAWDVGDGAHDDGGGCMMAMEAGRLLTQLDLIPRRTIRVVLFTNEENGGRGGKAYFDAHKSEPHLAAMEADSGSFAPFSIGIGGSPEQVKDLQRYLPLFELLGLKRLSSGGGGADIAPLIEIGVMGLSVNPNGERYFDFHHTNADTVDKIKPGDLERNAANMALMAYILAERDAPGAARAAAVAP